MAPKLSYIVCSTPRTGSNMLCCGLRETGVSGAPVEYFNPVPSTTSHKKMRQCSRFADYLDSVIPENTAQNGVFGVKLHWDHFEFLTGELGRIESFRGLSEAGSLDRLFGKPRYIYITRRDRVRQAVSWFIALRTQDWLDLGGNPLSLKKLFYWGRPKYDGREINRLLQVLEQNDRSWKSFFSKNSIEPLEILYEDLAVSYEGTLQRVLAHLGLEGAGPRLVSLPPTRPQSSRLKEQWACKYARSYGATRPRAIKGAGRMSKLAWRMGPSRYGRMSRLYQGFLRAFGPEFTEWCAFFYTRIVPENWRARVRRKMGR